MKTSHATAVGRTAPLGHLLVRWTFWLGIICGGALGAARAQAPGADFTAGLRKFQQLGLPDLGKARYVRVDIPGGDAFAMEAQDPKLTGNAWLLEARTNGTADVVLDQVRVSELVPQTVMAQRSKERAARAAAAGGAGEEPAFFPDGAVPEVLGSGWKDGDLAADLRVLIAYLEKKTEAANDDGDYVFKMHVARYFLLAVHAFGKGHAAEANRIVGLLFERGGGSRMVLRAAMSQVADAAYERAWRDFGRTGDWRAYLAAMEGALSRFANAWHQGPLVEKVAHQVRQQLERPAAPVVEGKGLSDEDVRIAAAWGQSNAVVSANHPLLRSANWLATDPAAEPPQGPAFLRSIQERGVQAVPLLVALLKDDWLVRMPGAERPFIPFDSGSDSGVMTPEEERAQFAHLPRPMSRGELARKMLEPLVLTQQELSQFASRGGMDTDELARRARAWHEKHRHEDRGAMRRQMLAEGRQEVFHAMLRSTNAQDRLAVEAYLMRTNRLAESLHQVLQYAQTHGSTAKAFVTRYLDAMKQLPSPLPEPQRRHLRGEQLQIQEEQARATLRSLEDMVSDKSFAAVLDELAKSSVKRDPQEWNQKSTVLRAKLAQVDPEVALIALLQACARASDAETGRRFLQEAASLRWISQRMPGGKPEPRIFKLPATAPIWKELMAWEEAHPGEPRPPGEGARMSAAMTMEMIYAENNQRQPAGVEQFTYLRRELGQIYRQRALARMAGKSGEELPGFPDPGKVTPERRKELREALLASPPEGQARVAALWTLDERLALPQMVAGDPALNAKLVAGSHRIREVQLAVTNAELAALCAPMKGQAFEKKHLQALIEECKRQAARGGNLRIAVERSLPLAGVSLSVTSSEDRVSGGLRPFPRPKESAGDRHGFDSGGEPERFRALAGEAGDGRRSGSGVGQTVG